MLDSRQMILLGDEQDVTRIYLAENLEADGYQVKTVCSRRQALVALCELMPDVLLVDVNGQMLSLVDTIRGGEGVAGRINPDVPIVVLTARGDELHRVRCLQHGADDVIAKPFSYPELRARVEAVLRRSRPQRRSVLRTGPIKVDLAARSVDVDGEPVQLSRMEFDLLRALAGEPGRVFTRQELMRDVWGYPSASRSRTLDSHIARLRAKLRAAGADRILVSIWGVGYRLDPPVAREAA